MSMNVSVLGLGAMGARMAARWLDAGHRVRVYNRSPERAGPLRTRGAEVAASPRAAADGADVVVSMVRDDAASESVWLDPDAGALAGLKPGAVAIESSTLTPVWVRRLAERVTSAGAEFVDAPVVGSRPQAEAGQLIYLLGSTPEALDRVRSLLDVTGGAIHHVGAVGSGAVMKLCVNVLFGIQTAALSEMLGLVSRSGIDLDAAVELLGALPITSPAMKGMGGLIARREFVPQFPIDLVEKDFGYAEAAASTVGATVPLTGCAREVYARARQAGFGGDNISGVAQLVLPDAASE
jgi:3-hydroxyisobutyrate dehydrogenase-like beta-hydroxyacid dehydrogenase